METVMLAPCSFSRSGNSLESSFLGQSIKARRSRDHEEGRKASVAVIQAVKQRKGPMRKMQQMYQQRQMQSVPRMPPAEDENPRFVIFIRSKNIQQLWYPLNIVSGGTAAKFMVGVTKNEWGKKIYGNTLTNNIGAAVYKDEEKIIGTVTRKFNVLKYTKEFVFGYKLVDEEKPEDALKPVDIIEIPPKEELKPITEKVSDFVGKSVENVKDTLGLK